MNDNIVQDKNGIWIYKDTGKVVESLLPDLPKFNKKDNPTNLFIEAKNDWLSGNYQRSAAIMDFLVTNFSDQADVSWRKIHLGSLIKTGAVGSYEEYPSYLKQIAKREKK